MARLSRIFIRAHVVVLWRHQTTSRFQQYLSCNVLWTIIKLCYAFANGNSSASRSKYIAHKMHSFEWICAVASYRGWGGGQLPPVPYALPPSSGCSPSRREKKNYMCLLDPSRPLSQKRKFYVKLNEMCQNTAQ